jgi:hypothetical protein
MLKETHAIVRHAEFSFSSFCPGGRWRLKSCTTLQVLHHFYGHNVALAVSQSFKWSMYIYLPDLNSAHIYPSSKYQQKYQINNIKSQTQLVYLKPQLYGSVFHIIHRQAVQ